jgi:hypothetical protein
LFLFLLGMATAGTLMQQDRKKVVRGLASTIVTGQKVANAVGTELMRKAAQTSEDFQDILAEARSQYEAERAAQAAETQTVTQNSPR